MGIVINIKACQSKMLDANSLLIMSIIESRNLDDWNWLLTLIPASRVNKYLNYLSNRGFIELPIEDPFRNFNGLKLVKKKKSKKVVDESSWGIFIEEFYNLWPKGVKSGGYSVRCGKESCSSKLKAFLNRDCPYNREIVIAATRNYIDKCKANDYAYMKLAPYFISKDGISVLETCCEEIVNGVVKEKNNIKYF